MDLPAPLVTQIDDMLTPAAGSVAGDERFLDLRQEVDKLAALAGAPVDWRVVASLGAALTREVGKDLAVIAYTALARLKLRDLPGLLAGVLALARLLRAPPPTLSPTKPRPRGAALEWLLVRLQVELPALAPAPADAPVLALLDAALRDLHATSQDVLGDMSPRFGPTLQALAAARADLPDAPSPPPPPDATATTAPLATTAPTPLRTDQAAPRTDQAAPAAQDAAFVAAHAPVDAPGPAWRPALAPWLAPLAVSPPCGLDPAGHEVFDAARQQLARLSALTGDPVDWPRVEAAADTLLRTVARDLRPATWLALARSHRGDLHGLALGLRLIATLLDDHPEDLHPRRPKPRRDTLDWFFKQAALALAAVPTPRLTAADLDALDAARQHLGEALATRLPDAPSLRPLRDALLAARERLPEPAAPPPSAAPPSVADASPSVADPSAPAITPPLAAPSATSPPFAPTPPVAPSVVTAPPVAPSVVTAPPAAPPPSLAAPAIHTVAIAAPASSTELDRFLAATADALLETARLLREASPADPRAYRLLRTGLWIHLTSLPPPRPDGNTNVPGLDDRDRSQLADLAARAAWPGLLTRSENLLVRHRLALDLQRLTVAALDGLGHADAALAVRAELRALFTRLPGLLDLRDRDGQPLADAATRQWLSRTVLAATADADSAEAPDWSALTPRLRGPDRMPALAEAQATIDAGASGRLRFTRRLGLAEALLPGDPALAHLLFAALADELDRGDIDAWDPTLAARCLASAARRPPPAIAPPAALLRLARVDIAAAAALLPSP